MPGPQANALWAREVPRVCAVAPGDRRALGVKAARESLARQPSRTDVRQGGTIVVFRGVTFDGTAGPYLPVRDLSPLTSDVAIDYAVRNTIRETQPPSRRPKRPPRNGPRGTRGTRRPRTSTFTPTIRPIRPLPDEAVITFDKRVSLWPSMGARRARWRRSRR